MNLWPMALANPAEGSVGRWIEVDVDSTDIDVEPVNDEQMGY